MHAELAGIRRSCFWKRGTSFGPTRNLPQCTQAVSGNQILEPSNMRNLPPGKGANLGNHASTLMRKLLIHNFLALNRELWEAKVVGMENLHVLGCMVSETGHPCLRSTFWLDPWDPSIPELRSCEGGVRGQHARDAAAQFLLKRRRRRRPLRRRLQTTRPPLSHPAPPRPQLAPGSAVPPSASPQSTSRSSP